MKKNIIKSFTLMIIFCLCGCSSAKVQSQLYNEYVLNIRTKKIHIAECPAIKKMSERNKKVTKDSLTSLFNEKYVICKKCRAGLKQPGLNNIVDNIIHRNLYIEGVENNKSVNEYLAAIDNMCKWYVNNVPTYASYLSTEKVKEYIGVDRYFKKYTLKNKGSENDYNVITCNPNDKTIDVLDDVDDISMANETAVKSYKTNYEKIEFKKQIAYYHCDLLKNADAYKMPGDDCVRLIFSIFNYMDSHFCTKYNFLSKMKFSNTNSRMLNIDDKNIAYAFMNLGFEIYDSNERVIDVNSDLIPEGYINKINSDFKLKKGDILSRNGHVHIYLGDGQFGNTEHFGWGRVYRKFPQNSQANIYKDVNNKYSISLINSKGKVEKYTRVYRYVGDVGDE